jgi:glyoxylase-like metal-dependent hydrolase (beta-lactamase superfamily II)
MKMLNRAPHVDRYIVSAVIAVGVMGAATAAARMSAQSAAVSGAGPGSSGVPYAHMPAIAPIGVRIDKYLDVPEAAKGPAVDPAKGYRTEKVGDGLYMMTDGGIQSMFMTYESGVVVMDAPQNYASHIREAIAAVTDKPITHLIYSHFHADHIGGAGTLGGHPIIIAHAETNRLLTRDNDPNRPLPTVTFTDKYRLTVGSQVLELSYGGTAHCPGNIFIYAPKQRTLMVIDVVFPGWMPWRRLALAQDIPAYFAQVKQISDWDFDTLVGGHVARIGTHADVVTQLAFLEDLKAAAANGLKTTKMGEGLDPADLGNTWAFYDQYIDRVAISCVNELTPKWSQRLAGFDVFIWDQCYSMEQSLRID